MDPQVIGGATAVISATIAALALLLTWRRDHVPAHPRVARAAAPAIGSVGVIGVVLVFVLGSPEPEGESAHAGPTQLIAAEYVRQAGALCTRMAEDFDRVKALQPQASAGIVTVPIERSTVRALSRLRPPDELETAHRAAVAHWGRRVELLAEAYRRSEQLTDREAIAQLAQADRLVPKMNRQFAALGLRECVI